MDIINKLMQMKLKSKLSFSALLFFTTFYIFSQNVKTVTGTVSDDGGVALPGVNVIIKGTAVGTVTDFDGVYKISV